MFKFLTLKLKHGYQCFEYNRKRQTRANKTDPICTGDRVEKVREEIHAGSLINISGQTKRLKSNQLMPAPTSCAKLLQ